MKRIIVLRSHLMWIMSMVWESMSDVSERIQSMTGSSSDSHTTQYVVQPVEQCFVQSFLRHRVTSQRNRVGKRFNFYYEGGFSVCGLWAPV